MPHFALHHISIVVTDLFRSLNFYQTLFMLEPIDRPPFAVSGAWLGCGGVQIHLVLYREGSFRIRPGIDANDSHFAFRTDDFDAALRHLQAHGFYEGAEDDDPMRIIVSREGRAGFPQLYLCDPDRNIIEVNGAE
jgi:catechol 2,3-dioxygenase-like lactoylglutathione lyase family enzyme